MAKLYFRKFLNDTDNLSEHYIPTPVPNVMWWYYMEKYRDSGIPLDADLCNKWLNEDLEDFFKKYPDELYKADITLMKKSDLDFYKKEILKEK